MRKTRLFSLLIVLLSLGAIAFADAVTGTVTNATTGKPAAGATVTVLDPMAGMLEVGTGKADGQGRYSINVPAARGPRLVRAERSGVNYFKMITPGTTSADLDVYDAAAKVDGIKGTADVVRLEAQGDTLQASEMFVLSNASQPPKTLSAPATFEFVLPEGAVVDDARAEAPGGQPISAAAKPAGSKNHYAFSFALKPGDTRLQVSYHMPYSGQAAISPEFTRSFEHYVVLVPSAISFTPKDPKQYQSMPGKQPGTNVQLSMQAEGAKALAFNLTGTGMFPEEGEAGAAAGGAAAGAKSGPGGGLGKPEEGPDALEKYRWYILAALVAILVGGGIWTHERTNQQAAAAAAEAAAPVAGSPAAASPAAPTAATSQPNPLLAALKEEIFTLEVEFKQGKISQEEYDKARAALDQTLQRALSRS